MARKSKQKSILAEALTQGWGFSFTIATLALLLILIILPSVTNPILKPLAAAIKPLGLIFCGVFYLIAAFKFLKQNSVKRDRVLNIKNEPIFNSEPTDYVITQKQQNEISKPVAWSVKLIQELEWRKFEELSVAYYREKGIKAETTPLGADGGIDIKLYQDDSGKLTTIIQCKSWASQVGVKQVREFLGVMTHEKIAKGFYMTSSGYTNDAIEMAKSNQITLINGEMLLMMIQRLSPTSQERLLALATSGDYKTPTCPSCGIKMVKRPSKKGDFWGCLNYPKGCQQKLSLRKIDRT
jgi:restriction system protein